MLPRDFPPHDAVFHYFNKRKWEGVFKELMDSISIRSSRHVDTDRRIDADKEKCLLEKLAKMRNMALSPVV